MGDGHGGAPATPTAFVHIGPGKTGTSTVQRALNEQREVLADLGVFVPGRVQMDTRRAVYDLMGRRIEGAGPRDHARVTGAWAPFAASVAGDPLPGAAFSEEMLALARPRVVRRLVASLSPRRVVVVATVRDLATALGSYWQQMVMMGRTETLTEFLSAVRDPGRGRAGAGVGFWMRQDLLRTLDAWETAVPRADLRLVTAPPRGTPPELLADRFGAVLGVPEGVLRSSRSRGNTSVGLAGVEAVRRLNVELGDSLRERQRLQLMNVLRNGLADRRGRPVVLPAEELEWVRQRSVELVAELRMRGYRVIGDLDELVPGRPTSASAAAPTDAEVAEAAVALLGAVAHDQSRLFTRVHQRRQASAPTELPPASAVSTLASRGRAASFRLRTQALHHADRSRVLGWAARAYLRRTSSR